MYDVFDVAGIGGGVLCSSYDICVGILVVLILVLLDVVRKC